MKRIALAVIVAMGAAGAGLVAQSGNPFHGRSDTGEIIRILPPPAAIRSPHDTGPTFAPVRNQATTYPASYGSGNLVKHSGPVMAAKYGFYALYWNNSASGARQTSLGYATLRDQMDAFLQAFSNQGDANYSSADTSADYSIVQQYGSSKSFSFGPSWGTLVFSEATKSSITDSALRTWLSNKLKSGTPGLTFSTDNIYGIYLPPGMKVTSGGASCSAFCGYHGQINVNGVVVKYAVFPYLNCAACSLSGLSVADMMTIVTSHEIREAATDPQLNAWYDAAGYEADDKCAWHNLYQMSTGGFWIQPEFSNGGTVGGITYPGPGCVVPR